MCAMTRCGVDEQKGDARSTRRRGSFPGLAAGLDAGLLGAAVAAAVAAATGVRRMVRLFIGEAV